MVERGERRIDVAEYVEIAYAMGPAAARAFSAALRDFPGRTSIVFSSYLGGLRSSAPMLTPRCVARFVRNIELVPENRTGG
jgi:hypothetical protein